MKLILLICSVFCLKLVNTHSVTSKERCKELTNNPLFELQLLPTWYKMQNMRKSVEKKFDAVERLTNEAEFKSALAEFCPDAETLANLTKSIIQKYLLCFDENTTEYRIVTKYNTLIQKYLDKGCADSARQAADFLYLNGILCFERNSRNIWRCAEPNTRGLNFPTSSYTESDDDENCIVNALKSCENINSELAQFATDMRSIHWAILGIDDQVSRLFPQDSKDEKKYFVDRIAFLEQAIEMYKSDESLREIMIVPMESELEIRKTTLTYYE